MRGFLAVVLALLLLSLAFGCGPAPEKPGTDQGAGSAAVDGAGGSAGKGSALRVALVTDAGGIDDKSFNASAWAGLQRAAEELKLAQRPRYLESREQSDYESNLSSLADQGHDLIFAVGYLMEDALKRVAPKYPNTRFAIIDGNAPDEPNCVALKFREEEGTFLAGYLAMSMSKTGAIGFVGGVEGALMTRFESGYRAGALAANKKGRVISKYIGNWTDAPKGVEMGRVLLSQGADVIFAAAGKGGLGVLDAVAKRSNNAFGIGVDADQDDLHPGRILTSVMKGVDTSVAQTTLDLAAGKWTPGEHVLGLKEKGVRLSPMRFTKNLVPDEVLKRIETLSAAIAEGKIVVPKTPEELHHFALPPGL